MTRKLTRIGIFYDGGYLSAASHHYRYHHDRGAHLDIAGLQELLRGEVASREEVHDSRCQIVDAHYFRGRMDAESAEESGSLLAERQFEDELMAAGISPHFLHLNYAGREKGIDVWFALEAFERAAAGRFDVAVLVTGDGDYLPLVRKLNGIGVRVMVAGWRFEHLDFRGRTHTTGIAQRIIDEASYHIAVDEVIDGGDANRIDALFCGRADGPNADRCGDTPDRPGRGQDGPRGQTHDHPRTRGEIFGLHIRDGGQKRFGFIRFEGGTDNAWFGSVHVRGASFEDLEKGQAVEFELHHAEGRLQARDVRPV